MASGATVPIIPDSENANFSADGLTTTVTIGRERSDNNLINRIVLQTHRLISELLDNDTDEQVVLSLLPISHLLSHVHTESNRLCDSNCNSSIEYRRWSR